MKNYKRSRRIETLLVLTVCLVFLPVLLSAQLQDSLILRMQIENLEAKEDSSEVSVQDWAIPRLIMQRPLGPDNYKHVARWFFNQPWPGIPTTLSFSEKQNANRLSKYKRLPSRAEMPLLNFPNH